MMVKNTKNLRNSQIKKIWNIGHYWVSTSRYLLSSRYWPFSKALLPQVLEMRCTCSFIACETTNKACIMLQSLTATSVGKYAVSVVLLRVNAPLKPV
jgi:hypothetical protein